MSIQLFGSSYTDVGNTNSDFLIKTRGKIKIQWGNKFIDLIKDGKINSDAKFIYQENEVGAKDGIYVLNDGSVILKVGDKELNLLGEVGNTYVSFQEEQQTTSEQKFTALNNIGFLYKSLSDLGTDYVQNGIVYITSEQKLYIIKDGEVSPFNVEIPNPYTKQFVIQKSNTDKGSLLILGEGIENSLAFNSFYLYNEDGGTYLDSNGRIYFKVNDSEKVIIDTNQTLFKNEVVSSMFKSEGASKANGFRLYVEGNRSTLEVDNLIVRNQSNEEEISNYLYPIYWDYKSNIVKLAEETEESDNLELTLLYQNKFKVGDILFTYIPYKNLEETEEEIQDAYQNILIPLKVIFSDQETIQVSIISELFDSSVTIDNILDFIKGQQLFYINTEGETSTILRRKENNIDLIEVSEPNNALENNVLLRIGNTKELGLKAINERQEIPFDKNGIYSDSAIFTEAQYTNNYNLPLTDDSSKFASTEWVNKVLASADITQADLYYGYKTATASDISKWIQNNVDLKKVIISATEDKYSIVSHNGILTTQLINDKVHITTFVSAITEDDTITYRSIDCMVNPTNYQVDSLSTYILFTRYAGYYYSKSANSSETTPVQFYYLGTSQGSFVVNSQWPYLWQWDNIKWTLIDKYVEDTTSYLFVRSTDRNSYADRNTAKYYLSPGGFITYIKDGIEYEVGFGISNYIENSSTYDEEVKDARLEKLASLIVNPTYNIKPSNKNYSYLWAIESQYELTDIDKWQLLSTRPSTTTIETDSAWTFGNCSTPSISGFDIYRVDNNGIALDQELGDFEFKGGLGDFDNWSDRIWVKSFIRYSLCVVLNNTNTKKLYNPISGWDFHWQTVFVGRAGGQLGIYFGEPNPPKSDDPNSPEYYPRTNIYELNGQVMSYGYSIQFRFNKVTLGKLYQNIGMGQFIQLGQRCAIYKWFYDVDFTSYNAIVTNLSTGETRNING